MSASHGGQTNIRQLPNALTSTRNSTGIATKLATALANLKACTFCAHQCQVDRLSAASGTCGCNADTHVYFEGKLWAEEAFLSPSYGVFFAGCNIDCAFCYAAKSNRAPQQHSLLDLKVLADTVNKQKYELASFSFIGGEPTVNLHAALALIPLLPDSLPVVWNSNFYFSKTGRDLLDGSVDAFVADIHFGNDNCAWELAKAAHYMAVVLENLHWAKTRGQLIIRQLVLPGHLQCCTFPILKLLNRELTAVPIRILLNYMPPETAPHKELVRVLSQAELAQLEVMLRAYDLNYIS